MITKAFGPNGYEGDFRITSEETLKMVRESKESVIAVLGIFLEDPEEKKIICQEDNVLIPIEESIEIAHNKIKGIVVDDNELNVQEQVEMLINKATDLYNLAHLHKGWNPLW
ncbi:PIKK family atypical protein kinase [Histomonas meleagridis]|uniref:PIKK family atypical protein kinase n=1 Tax=Histomonas meleagridis TaxID=135588 RepID=UPI00355A464F|nr:PIKK family atypical protein kinase [Histomonas meleagridis]KAH0802450.1 PIKK family atypical protein kinase [Histomonas meleagridis]